MDVNLQFGLCSAVASAFAPSASMSLSQRLFHISISSRWYTNDIAITYKLTIVQSICNLDCAVHSQVHVRPLCQHELNGDCVSYQHQLTYGARMTFHTRQITHAIQVNLQFGDCKAIASDFAPSAPIRSSKRLFRIHISSRA